MYTQVSSSQYVGSTGAGTVSAFSQAIDMEGANAVQLSVVVLNTSGTSTNDAGVQEGSDLENWSDVASGTVALGTTPTYKPLKVTNIASRYVRLHFRVGGTGANYSILSASINTAQL